MAPWRFCLYRPIADKYILVSNAPSARGARLSLASAPDKAQCPPSLLAIGEPKGNGRPPLRFSGMELERVSKVFSGRFQKTLSGREATRQGLNDGISGATDLHLICHGEFSERQPLESALILAGEDRLTLRDLYDNVLDLSDVKTVVLSVCKAGVTDFFNVPDRVCRFSRGVPTGRRNHCAQRPLACGRYLGVSPVVTVLPLLLERVLSPSKALREARVWLREATVRELRLVELYKKALDASRGREGAPFIQAMLHFKTKAPDYRPFAHPYFWACCTLTGVDPDWRPTGEIYWHLSSKKKITPRHSQFVHPKYE